MLALTSLRGTVARQPLPACVLFAIFFLCTLVGASLRTSVQPAHADPPGTCSDCYTKGWWDDGPDWGFPAIHMALVRGPSDTSEVIWWPEGAPPGTRTRIWRVGNLGALPDSIAQLLSRSVAGTTNIFCSGHATLADGKLITLGGDESRTPGINDVQVYDPVARTWASKTAMASARYYPTATTDQFGKVLATAGEAYWLTLAFGGRDGAGSLHNDLDQVYALRQTPAATTQYSVAGQSPQRREGHSVVFQPVADFLSKRLFVFGGRDSSATGVTYYNDVWELKRNDDSLQWRWRRMAPDTTTRPSARWLHSAVYVPQDTSMLIYGADSLAL